MIEIKNLCKSYPLPDGSIAPVLRDINLTVADQSITAIVGPSGAGKSTLSKCISLLEAPTSGSILVNGKDISRLSGAALRHERRAIGTIFQSSALLHRKTAAQNIALPLEFLRVVHSDIDRRVRELLEAVGLTDKAHFYPAQLSGGQQQRIGIARALALHPKVLLSDEATSGLDPQVTESILGLLKHLRDEFHLSIILITHEMDVVRAIADDVAAISGGVLVEQGRIQDLVANPDSALGRQLVPLKTVEPTQPHHTTAEITYGADGVVPEDWLSTLAEQLNARLKLLGANIERVRGKLHGRALLALDFKGVHPDAGTLHTVFHSLGLKASLNTAPLVPAHDVLLTKEKVYA
ncbi:methionine import ATP-binding protein MetN [Betaproteobacteria bacterium]|nr:methionine import ATP-binding protein MetN [Betaproteobacteria bacterium]